ncbi:hypothetical protein ACA910_001461 [Epithemia clementina (nom. ined.)]
MTEPSRIMPNIYYLGFKTGQAIHYLSSLSASATTSKLPSIDQVLQRIYDFPKLYGNWWWNLVRSDPLHVLVETTLIVSIIYILVARSKDWKETEEHLSVKEEEELLREWKLHGRAPLTPSTTNTAATAATASNGRKGNGTPTTITASNNTKSGMSLNLTPTTSSATATTSATTASAIPPPPSLVVHKVHGPFMDISIDPVVNDENNHLSNSTRGFHSFPHRGGSSKALGTNNSATTVTTRSKFLSGGNKHHQQPTPNKDQILTVLNFATFDYLGMSSNQPSVRQAADRALTAYGCGSCGPRGFYGTIDAHLQLEKEFAAFLKVDGAILYSDGASTCASTVAAFCKRGDLIVCDEGIYEPLRTGVTLSRAHVKWFKHNDMQDLRRVLTNIQAHDKKVKRPINAQRRFLVVEGLYRTTGSIVPLKDLVELKHEFSYRLILDESNSFGTLGATGRGVHELFQCRLMHDVEITTIALENSMGAIGGITVGTEEVVEHQRLSGSGYCFSASSPPFTATAAMQSLKLLQESPEVTLYPLQDNIAYMYYKLTQLCHEQLDDVLLVTSAPNSPILLLQVADIPETRDLDEVLFLQEVVQECLLLQQPSSSSSLLLTTLTTTNTTTNAVSSSSLSSSSSTTLSSSLSSMSGAGPNGPSNGNNINTSTTTTTTTTTPIHGMVLVATQAPPGIRITVSAAHTHEQLDLCLRILTESVEIVLSRTSH